MFISSIFLVKCVGNVSANFVILSFNHTFGVSFLLYFRNKSIYYDYYIIYRKDEYRLKDKRKSYVNDRSLETRFSLVWPQENAS